MFIFLCQFAELLSSIYPILGCVCVCVCACVCVYKCVKQMLQHDVYWIVFVLHCECDTMVSISSAVIHSAVGHRGQWIPRHYMRPGWYAIMTQITLFYGLFDLEKKTVVNAMRTSTVWLLDNTRVDMNYTHSAPCGLHTLCTV